MWKYFPYWLRGVSIFGVIFLPVLLLVGKDGGPSLLILPFQFVWQFLGFYQVSELVALIIRNPITGDIEAEKSSLALIYIVVGYMILGGIAGWMIGKSKKRQATTFRVARSDNTFDISS